jgi:hypothetical protein
MLAINAGVVDGTPSSLAARFCRFRRRFRRNTHNDPLLVDLRIARCRTKRTSIGVLNTLSNPATTIGCNVRICGMKVDSLIEQGSGLVNEDQVLVGQHIWAVFDGATSVNQYVDESGRMLGSVCRPVSRWRTKDHTELCPRKRRERPEMLELPSFQNS